MSLYSDDNSSGSAAVSNILGLMSGTSLDGLDLALCRFSENKGRIDYEVVAAKTVSYPDEWQKTLSGIHQASASAFALAHSHYGTWLGQTARSFLDTSGLHADAVASHGHTIFHQPASGMTFQLGSGAALAVHAGIPAVCDFRTTDVALGGQGAPLVPVGDELLFGDYAACLNIGGIANISYRIGDRRMAYDVCAANMILNRLSAELGKAFDENGDIARSGKLIPELSEALNALPYFSGAPPKSLGREDVEQWIMPVISNDSWSIADRMHSFVVHAATQIAQSLPQHFTASDQLLITGGGAHHLFLVDEIRKRARCTVVVPSKETVDFKEAIIFAFLGWLRLRGKNNALKSVTGARRDSCGGCIYLP